MELTWVVGQPYFNPRPREGDDVGGLRVGPVVFISIHAPREGGDKAPIVQQLPGTAIQEMEAGDWDLTLFTCDAGGTARVTVRCERVS